eukprot:GDKJ01047432.1.p1 GENE.GDKJ01047432.1~~GDKJ01047432.1.p1  ORF type:complete len:725 (+),score=117.42 GDKJ01047432.1:100-2175(+)
MKKSSGDMDSIFINPDDVPLTENIYNDLETEFLGKEGKGINLEVNFGQKAFSHMEINEIREHLMNEEYAIPPVLKFYAEEVDEFTQGRLIYTITERDMQNMYYRDLIIEALVQDQLTSSSKKSREAASRVISEEILSNDRDFTVVAIAARLDARMSYDPETNTPNAVGGRDVVLLTLRVYDGGRSIECTPAIFNAAPGSRVEGKDKTFPSVIKTISISEGGGLYEYTVEITSDYNEKETRIGRLVLQREVAKNLQMRGKILKPLAAKPPSSRRVSRYVFHGSVVEFDEFNFREFKSRLTPGGVRMIPSEGSYKEGKGRLHVDYFSEWNMAPIDVFDQRAREQEEKEGASWRETFQLLSGRKLAITVSYRVVLPDDPTWHAQDPSKAFEEGEVGWSEETIMDSAVAMMGAASTQNTKFVMTNNGEEASDETWKGTTWASALHGQPIGIRNDIASTVDTSAGPKVLLTGQTFANFGGSDCVHAYGDPISFEAWSVNLGDGEMPGGPKIVAEVTSRDHWGRVKLLGVGCQTIPLSPGYHTIEMRLSRPKLSFYERFREWYTGGVNTFTDYTLAAHSSSSNGSLPQNRSSIETVSHPGILRFNFATLTQVAPPVVRRYDEATMNRLLTQGVLGRNAGDRSGKPKRPSPNRARPSGMTRQRSTSPGVGGRPSRAARDRFTVTAAEENNNLSGLRRR